MNKLLFTALQCLLMALSIIVPSTALQAQCGCAYHFETIFPATVKEAPVVIEGKVTNDLVFFGGKDNQDYHSSTIIVYKVLKGDFEATEVELIEPNVFGDNGCFIGMGTGIFFLYPSEVKVTPRNNIAPNLKFRYKDIADTGCNFVNYNAKDNKGRENYLENPYGIYSLKDIKQKIYQTTEKVLGYTYKEIAAMPKKDFGGGITNENMVAKTEEVQAISISSISPTTITAGTFDTLTIRGSGFGDTSYTIGFRNVEIEEEKYFSTPKNHILVHTDTLFKVIVPFVVMNKNIKHDEDKLSLTAGSGKIAILQNGTVKKKSTQILTVSYAQQTYAQNDTTHLIYKVRLTSNRDSLGKDFMFWQHASLRNNNPARQLTKQVVEQWRCASGVNFTLSCDSTTTVPLDFNDDISTLSVAAPGSPLYNSVTYANASTRKRIKVCASLGYAIVSAIDVVFRNYPAKNVDGVVEDLEWYYNGYTPGAIYSGQSDFYTAALHEFGHAHLLGHVNKSTELMNTYSKSGLQGVNHTISPTTDLVAATNIMQLSTTNPGSLCLKAMEAVPTNNCALPTCANIGCSDPGYPLQVSFELYPEHCLDDDDYNYNNIEGSWYNTIAKSVTIIAKDQSLGNIVSRQWNIPTDSTALYSNQPCNDLQTIDTCRSLFWTLPGNKNLSLTVTDANGCSATYQQTITIIDTCPLDLPIETSTQLICNTGLLGCGSNQNIQLQITDLANIVGSGCFRYLIEYNATDPTVSTATQTYTDIHLIRDETQNKLLLNCLQQGYYKIKITDEVTACEATKIIYLMPPPAQLPIIDQYTNTPDSGCSTCTGQIELLAVNGNTDLSNYTFSWSGCDGCNDGTIQQHLCTGIYTITATDTQTGCSAVKGITINYDTGGDTNPNGIVTGIHISVEPTVFNDVSNVRIALPEPGEVTIEVYNLNGVLVKKLVDKVYYTDGEFIITHNATNLNDGLYIYKLKVCEKQKTDLGIKY